MSVEERIHRKAYNELAPKIKQAYKYLRAFNIPDLPAVEGDDANPVVENLTNEVINHGPRAEVTLRSLSQLIDLDDKTNAAEKAEQKKKLELLRHAPSITVAANEVKEESESIWNQIWHAIAGFFQWVFSRFEGGWDGLIKSINNSGKEDAVKNFGEKLKARNVPEAVIATAAPEFSKEVDKALAGGPEEPLPPKADLAHTVMLKIEGNSSSSTKPADAKAIIDNNKGTDGKIDRNKALSAYFQDIGKQIMNDQRIPADQKPGLEKVMKIFIEQAVKEGMTPGVYDKNFDKSVTLKTFQRISNDTTQDQKLRDAAKTIAEVLEKSPDGLSGAMSKLALDQSKSADVQQIGKFFTFVANPVLTRPENNDVFTKILKTAATDAEKAKLATLDKDLAERTEQAKRQKAADEAVIMRAKIDNLLAIKIKVDGEKGLRARIDAAIGKKHTDNWFTRGILLPGSQSRQQLAEFLKQELTNADTVNTIMANYNADKNALNALPIANAISDRIAGKMKNNPNLNSVWRDDDNIALIKETLRELIPEEIKNAIRENSELGLTVGSAQPVLHERQRFEIPTSSERFMSGEADYATTKVPAGIPAKVKPPQPIQPEVRGFTVT